MWAYLLVTWAGLVWLLQWGWPRLFTYRVRDGVEFVLFGRLRLWRIDVADVALVEAVPFRELVPLARPELLLAARLGNRIYAPRGVVIHRRKGLLRVVAVSPDDPDQFTGELRRLGAVVASR